MKHYPIRKEELKTELEQRLFKIYSRDTEIYTEMLKNNPEAKELWDKINKTDLEAHKKYQEILFKE